jgi:hypothetical protein
VTSEESSMRDADLGRSTRRSIMDETGTGIAATRDDVDTKTTNESLCLLLDPPLLWLLLLYRPSSRDHYHSHSIMALRASLLKVGQMNAVLLLLLLAGVKCCRRWNGLRRRKDSVETIDLLIQGTVSWVLPKADPTLMRPTSSSIES